MSKLEIGLQQAKILCQMKYGERLAFIAEGLPLILDSARGLWKASQLLKDAPREANILEGHAEEEAAKILILIDLARCPRRLAGPRTGSMVRWFYDHLARLIYAKAVSWKPMNVKQLRDYVDGERKAHYVEGEMGEYIMPNWELYSREARLYVDIEAHEKGLRGWSAPTGFGSGLPSFDPLVLRTAEALSALGIFSHKGLKAVADIWGELHFVDEQGFDDSRRLTRTLLERLDSERLFTDAAEDEHVSTIYNTWQMPMYELDFSLIPIPLDVLQRERDNIFFNEVGW